MLILLIRRFDGDGVHTFNRIRFKIHRLQCVGLCNLIKSIIFNVEFFTNVNNMGSYFFKLNLYVFIRRKYALTARLRFPSIVFSNTAACGSATWPTVVEVNKLNRNSEFIVGDSMTKTPSLRMQLKRIKNGGM